jgi:hypothetical protein
MLGGIGQKEKQCEELTEEEIDRGVAILEEREEESGKPL